MLEPRPRRAPLEQRERAAYRTTLGPLRRRRLTDDVAARLVAGIIDGKFRLGERLPAERDLARYLDVGRPTLREAIVTLRAVGLLDVRHGEGTFVVDRAGDFLVKALSWVVLLDAHADTEIHEARQALESAVAELAAERATEADATELQARFAQLTASTRQRKRFAAADAAFDDSLARASRNHVLGRVLEALRLLERHDAHARVEDYVEQRRTLMSSVVTAVASPNPSARAVVRRAPGSGINGGRVPAAPKLAQLRIGMITPSSNIMVEPISAAVAAPFGDELSLHFARIPVTRISLDRPSQQQFDLDAMLSAARLLADARVHAICWNGISAAWKGSASDRWICDAVQRETGIPATSATLAQLEAFRVRGIRRFGLAVPYRDDVRRAIVRVYREEGFECVSSAHLGISVNFEFAEIPSESLRRLVRQADSPDAEAIVVTCTNLATARLVDELEAELAKPVLDSLLLALWHPLRLLGWNKSIPGWGRVLADGFDITERHRS